MNYKKLLVSTVIVIILSLTVYFKLCKRQEIEFLSWSIDRSSIKSGGSFKIDYFWEINREIEDKIYVFVHFIKDGNIVFQNDHRLLDEYMEEDIALQGGVWKESYTVKVPLEVPDGEYTVSLGLWLPEEGGKRLKIKGKSTSIKIGKINVGQNELLKNLKGRIVFQSYLNGKNQIYVMNDGSIKRLTSPDANNEYPRWSPDGKSIVFVSDRDGNREIYIMDARGNNQRRLTSYSDSDTFPSWHPDGRKIIFASDRDGAMNFQLINRDGSGLTKITDFKDGTHDMPNISPDGSEVLFVSDMASGWQVFKMDIDGGNIQQMSDISFGHCDGTWSHDGKRIVCVSREGTGNSDIWIMDNDGKNKQRLTTHKALDYNPRFSPDDKKIIFSSQRDGNWDLYVMDVNGGNLNRVFHSEAQESWSDWRS